MSASAEVLGSTMQTVLGDLRNQYTSALAQISGRWTWDTDSRSQQVAAFTNSVRFAIDTLDRMQAQVLSGQKSFATWKDLAISTQKDIADQLGYSHDWALSTLLADTLAKTAGDVKAGVVDVASVGVGLVPVVVVGLVALVVLRFSR